jgi:CO/xanthine dehydrogenase FAD-binding subunit
MRAAEFAYFRAGNLTEAVALLADLGPDARPLSGGQSLIPAMVLRLARPSALVDLGRIPELHGISLSDGTVTLRALTTHKAIEESVELKSVLPILPAAAEHIAHPAVRSRGTFGGSIANADPAAEWPCIALALGGTVSALGTDGPRSIPITEFFQGPMTTALSQGEILTEVSLPTVGPDERVGFSEFARQAGAFGIVLTAIRAKFAPEGELIGLRIAIGGCGGTPILACDNDQHCLGKPLDPQRAALIADRIAVDLDAQDDQNATAEDRRDIVRTLLSRKLVAIGNSVAGRAA